MTSLIYSFDIFGHDAKLRANKEQKTYKTMCGVCFSVLYFLMAVVVIFWCIQPSIRNLVEYDDDDVTTARRNLAGLPA
jgi:hypothetical protein